MAKALRDGVLDLLERVFVDRRSLARPQSAVPEPRENALLGAQVTGPPWRDAQPRIAPPPRCLA
jgi:hypothetical protein